MREIELKFVVGPAFRAEAIAGQAGVAAVVAQDPLELSATYYDTRDLRLARSGVTLRYRTGEGDAQWTVKLPQPGSQGVVRDELSFAGAHDAIPREAQDLVVGHSRSEPLEPVAQLVTKRERWRLRAIDGSDLAVVYEDDVAVVERGRTLTHFREVELESVTADLELLRQVGDAFVAAGAVPTEAVPKAVRALGPRATAPPDLPAEPGRPTATAGDVVGTMIASAAARIVGSHAAVCLGSAQGVHRMRVGTRRLRSDLRTYQTLVDAGWVESVAPDLKWLAGLLGRVRDLDVLTERVRAGAADLGQEIDPLFESLSEETEQHRRALLDALRSDRYGMLLDVLVRAAHNPPLTRDAVTDVGNLAALARPTWQRLRKAVKVAGHNPDDEVLHALRIRVKRSRYAAEALNGAVSATRSHERFVRLTQRLQEVLGEHQDATVAQHKLRTFAQQRAGSAQLLMAVGRLVEREHMAAAAARQQWRAAWKELDSDRATKWLPT